MNKKMREKGKLSFSRYFQNFNEGDSVAVVIEPSLKASFPKRLHGRTGRIDGKRGRSYIVELNDQEKKKSFIIAPIHLKKIRTIDKNDK